MGARGARRAWRLFRWRPLPRPTDWRSVYVTAALVGTVLVSAGAAWGVHVSAVEHRRAVRTALVEYAKFAARSYGDRVLAEGGRLRVRLTAPIFGTRPRDPAQALTLAEFAAISAITLDDEGLANDPLRGFLRIDRRTGRYEAIGLAARPDVARQIRAMVTARSRPLGRRRAPFLAYLDVDGEPVSLGFDRQVTAAGDTVATFGYTVSRRRWMAAVSERIVRESPLTPPSLMGPDWDWGTPIDADTLLELQVTDHGGRELYRSRPHLTSTVRGEFSFRTGPGGFVTRATLAPAFVAQMTSAHEHEDRDRLLLALPLAALVLAAAAMLHLMRERELARARRDFVASVSHELRTPLAQIRLFSETLLLQREKNEEERLRWLGVIGSEARRLGDLVESILLFSHVDAARVRLEPERTDLGELAEDVVEGYLPLADARGMRLLADAPSRICVDVDPRAMRQVVVNLLDNALKYGPAGQRVTVEVERTDGHARLAVSDEGPGVPAAARERVWQPFVRLGNGGSSAHGSGIGLAVVRGLVEHQGGRVFIDDAPGGGARFIVLLPLADPPPPPAQPAAAPYSLTTAERTVSGAGAPVGPRAANHQNTSSASARTL